MPTGVKVPLTFKVHKGGQLVSTETLTQDIIKIGKASSSHLRIEDESVSRMHAVVEVTVSDDGKPQVQIIDLGSTKGTFVNGQKVNKTALHDGDSITLGDVKVVVSIGRPATVTAPPIAITAPPPMPGAPPIAQPSIPAIPPPIGGGPAAMAMPASMTATAVVAPLGSSPELPAAGALPAGVQRALMSPDAVEVRDGSTAIEVTAMFGDAVLDVRHYSNPRATGKVSGATKVIKVVGLGLLVAACVCFGLQLMLANRDAVAKQKHDQDKDYPYIPAGPQPGLEYPWIITLLAGVGALTYGALRGLSERQARDFRIGTTPECEFKVPGELAPMAEFPLVHSTGQSYEVLITPQMQGDLTENDQKTKIGDLITQGKARQAAGEAAGGAAYALDLRQGQRLKVDLGENTFLLAAVPPPRRHPTVADLDWGFLAYLGGAFLGAMILVALMFAIPPDSKTLSGSSDDDAAEYAKYLVKPPEEKQEDIQNPQDKGKKDPGGKGRKAAGAEGKMGNKKAPDTHNKYGIKGPTDNQDLHMAKQFAEQDAQQAGVLGFLSANQGVHGPTSIFGQDTALGNDAENALGNLMGDQVGDALGAGGLGLQGTGAGGGGTGEGTIGLGNLGTIGHGGGGGNGQGYGSGAGTLGTRHAGTPDVVPGRADVHGALDKDTIRRVIHYHLNEVKFCYNQELQKNPNLKGREVVAFTIAPDGSVVVAQSVGSMGDPAVDQCIVEVMRRLKFPKPEGGGIVQVNSYPFVLSSQ